MHRTRSLSLTLGLFFVACSSSQGSPPPAAGEVDSGTSSIDSGTSDKPDTATLEDTTAPRPDAPPSDAPIADGLAVQEWGTYTSVQASDGHALGGLHHEDETLPAFVQRRNWSDRSNYYFENLAEEPLQQLETPVLYFWSKKAQDVQVQIDFPQGVVGQWYPDATKFSPDLGNCKALEKGSMTWNVTVDPSIDPSTFRPVDPKEIWAPSRNVASTPVHFTGTTGSADEREQFIFYRGLGKFNPEVKVIEGVDGSMHVTNGTHDDIASAFVLRVTADGGTIVSLGALKAGTTFDTKVPTTVKSIDNYVADAKKALHDALMASGLRDDVAQAMVDTWTRSWFKNVGLRVLYLAPRAWTDSWLPTTITPTPTSLVRTLVGRIESITPSEETSLIAAVKDHAKSGAAFDVTTLGRFSEPRLRRAIESLTDAGEITYGNGLIDKAHALP